MAFIYDNYIPEMLILIKIQATHGLDGGEGDALSDIDLSFGDRTKEGRIHVQLSTTLTLREKVFRVSQPECPPSQLGDHSDTHLSLTTASRALENAVMVTDNCIHSFLLVIVQWDRALVIDLDRGLELRVHLTITEERAYQPEDSKGENQRSTAGFVKVQMGGCITRPEVHP